MGRVPGRVSLPAAGAPVGFPGQPTRPVGGPAWDEGVRPTGLSRVLAHQNFSRKTGPAAHYTGENV